MDKGDYPVNPNTNAEIYRNMTPADRPPVPDKHLQFIEVYNDERVILGGSNLTDRYWSGTIWYFDNCKDFKRENNLAATRTESTVRDAVFLEDDKFILAEDGGIIQILKVLKPPEEWAVGIQCSGYTCHHDDSITSLAVFESKSHFISGGLDCCLKVWQTSTLLADKSYQTAHTDIITCVDVLSKSDSVFVSTSLDSEAVVWDVRKEKPAQRLYKSGYGGLTAVCWNSLNEHEIAVGGEDGSVLLIDTRKPEELIFKSIEFRRPVHRLKFHPKRNNWLAGCCNDTTVKVLDSSQELSVIFQDNSHSDFVRGLAWSKDELLTCSWDNTVLKHHITSKD